MAIDVERFLRIKKRMNQILADNTGRTVGRRSSGIPNRILVHCR